jgi:hypothetical protein
MDPTKPWWQSIGVWGAAIATGAQLYGIVTGHVIAPDDQAALSNAAVQTASWVQTGITLGGIAMGLWGRLRATTALTK